MKRSSHGMMIGGQTVQQTCFSTLSHFSSILSMQTMKPARSPVRKPKMCANTLTPVSSCPTIALYAAEPKSSEANVKIVTSLRIWYILPPMAKGTLSLLNFQRMALSSFQLRMVTARAAAIRQ